MTTPYQNPSEAMEDQLRRVRLWLARHQLLYAERDLHPDPRSRHMFVSDAEAADTAQGSPQADSLRPQLKAIELALEQLQEELDQRLEETLRQGSNTPLEELAAAFQLEPRVLDVLVALVAPEVDPRVARAYTNAWADFTRKQPDLSFVLELLEPDWQKQQELREILVSHPTLEPFGLLHITDENRWAPHTPWLYRSAKVSERVVDFLLTGRRDRLDKILGSVAQLQVGDGEALRELLLPQEIKDYLESALRAQARQRQAARVALLGPEGCGRRSLARGMAAMPGRKLLVLDGQQMPLEMGARVEILRAAMRDARLAEADLYLNLPEGFVHQDTSPLEVQRWVQWLDRFPETLYLGITAEHSWMNQLRRLVHVRVPFPTAEVQEALWRRQFAGRAVLEPGFTIEELVSSYALSGGSIEASAAEAMAEARIRTARGRALVIQREHAFEAAQHQLSHRLGILAEKVTRMLSWEDLVLPDKTLQSLQALIAQYRNQNQVFSEWGFSSKVPYGRGLSALFHGPPGTGKTMVAGVIARDLGLELYKIDLSRVVDKYIGETEKNLGRIFDEAARSRAILLFDEADSLFSKRTQVKSSHDRYANLETNYLLQRIETFDGVCLLTTNFEKSIDDAFKRRLRFKIAFPFPDKVERERLWRAMIPEQAGLAPSTDFARLASDFEMTGGHIKNAVLRAAFAAARARQRMDDNILYEAAIDEYREMGKLIRA